jgi:hypothetical protein
MNDNTIELPKGQFHVIPEKDEGMQLNEYQSLAMRTAKVFPEVAKNLDHVALGIASEVGELCLTVAQAWMRLPFNPENINEEIGDASWFSALACEIMGWNFEECFLTPDMASDMSTELAAAVLGRNPIAMTLVLSHFGSEIVTIIKAHIIYGKELDAVMMRRNLNLLVTTLSLLSDLHGIPYVEITLAENIAKLAKRYPEKYSDAAAIERADKQ